MAGIFVIRGKNVRVKGIRLYWVRQDGDIVKMDKLDKVDERPNG